MNREMLKSVTLVSLFILCIVLTGQLMLSLSTDRQESAVQVLAVNKTYDMREVFSPQSYMVSFGGGIYTQNYSELNSKLWNYAVESLQLSVDEVTEDTQFQPVEASKWVELIKGRAVRFRLPFYVSLSELRIMLGIEAAGTNSEIKFNSILFSTHVPDAIYFGNESEHVYFRLSGNDKAKEIADMIGEIEKTSEIEYRRVEDLFGVRTPDTSVPDFDNNSIYPITSSRVDFVNVSAEVDILDEDESALKSYANKAFGRQFNFVKKMRDVDGSIIYLYGYGNKALRLGADGSIEYTQRLSSGQKLDALKLSDALNISLGYVDEYGGIPASLYLADFTQSTDNDGNVKYNFEYAYKVKDLPIVTQSTESGHSIQVEIVGNQVTHFLRRVHRYKDSFMLDIYPRALTINEVLERNSTTIQSDYESRLAEGEALSSSEIWARILGDIKHVEMAYYLENGKTYLYPVWKLDIGNRCYLFRLYDGRLLRVQMN